MTETLTIKTNSIFDSVIFDENTDCWTFKFTESVYASSFGFWRLFKANKIKLVSFDNGQLFGNPKPLDLVAELTKLLTGESLSKITIIKDNSDLILHISPDFRIEIYIASSGYETYEFSIEGKRYIGQGAGEVSII